MGVTNRPYIGSWRIGQKQLVQHTPDALVYINGDISLPGCPKCNGKIDMQQYVTDVSVDVGTDPGAMSATFTLSVPVHSSEAFARDARFILRPGLEVHIYYRGYFPVAGLYSNLDDPRNVAGGIQSSGTVKNDAPITSMIPGTKKEEFPASMEEVDFSKVDPALMNKWLGRGMDQLGGVEGQRATVVAGVAEIIEKYWRQKYPDAEVIIKDHHRGKGDLGNHSAGSAIDYIITYNDGQDTVPNLQSWAGTQRLIDEGRIPPGGNGIYINGKTTTGTSPEDQGAPSKKGSSPGSSSEPHYDFRGSYGWGEGRAKKDGTPTNWVWVDTNGRGGHEYGPEKDRPLERRGSEASLAWLNENGLGDVNKYIRDRGKGDSFTPKVGDLVPNLQQELGQEPKVEVVETPPPPEEEKPNEVKADPAFNQSLLDEVGLAGFGLEDVLAYPYYHAFRGVITQVSHSYSTGVQSISVQCASMLHFWQYHRISTNASLFGARPLNSKLKSSVVGHNYTGMHPYEIMYTLHHDVAGSAAGVAWALSQKTNQDARSPVTGESLFSLNIKYWEQRFNSKEIKLRMHGITGDLFSAAQAAFLGQTSSAALTSLLRNRFNRKTSYRNPILQRSIALGLTRNKRLEALVQAQQTRDTEAGEEGTPSVELNMVEMQAFVTNVGNWGNYNLFESTYESKMDIAQRVMEVTGFEFFQDVDGDFVFKPPMYNLDTSSARAYRIEDIDIINININEQEPQVTYMTCKGAGFKNFGGSGLEGEWGVQGQYIDYRLVAQFGWRPGDFETSYFNDPKSMFFAAISRLDILNAPMNSATVTIPMRPEIRPGYPFYIVYLDCFYYCPSFNHGYSVGGQAITTLQLTAKRAKFYAPGNPTKNGIEAIDLGAPTMPQRPLEVLDNAGRPRLSGFPNVVMALDPNKLNPLFLVVGSDISMIDNPDSLANVVDMALKLKVIRPANQDDLPVGEWGNVDLSGELMSTLYIVDLGEKRKQLVYFQNPYDKSTDRPLGSPTKPSGAIDLLAAAQVYVAEQRIQATKITEQKSKLTEINDRIIKLRSQLLTEYRAKAKTAEDYEKKVLSVNSEIAKLEQERRDLIARYDQTQRDFESFLSNEQDVGIKWLTGLIARMGEQYSVQYTARGAEFGDLTNTTNLLDMLSNKKATMVSGNLPGDFRYYSASHPDPKHQGQPETGFKSKNASEQSPAEDTATTSEITRKTSLISKRWQNIPVNGYVRTNQITYPPGALRPEAKLTRTLPQRGIRVLTNNPEEPEGEVIPTSEIRELMFVSHPASLNRRIVSTKRRRKSTEGEVAIREALQKSARAEVVVEADMSIEEVFFDWWEKFKENIQLATIFATDTAKENKINVPQFPVVEIPTHIIVGGTSFDVTVAIGQNYKFSDSDDTIKDNPDIPQAWPGSETYVTLQQFWVRCADSVGASAYRTVLSKAKFEWFNSMLANGINYEDAQFILYVFEQFFGSPYGVQMPTVERSKESDKSPADFRIQTPVFPVSDANGYEVIGSYRYGRDVDIEPDGVFDVLHRQDPLSILDKHTMDLILQVIVNKEGIYVEVEVTDENGQVKTDANGNPVTRRELLQGQAAYDEAMKKIIPQLRDRYTDKQLIDLGLASKSSDPDMLEMNLMNWFSEKGKEGIQKVPINNAAYSLADMALHTTKRVCSCKMAEAEVLLDAAAQNNFLDFASPANQTAETAGTGDEDRPTQWLMSEVARTSPSWKQSQDAMRGTVPDTRESTLLTTGSAAGKSLGSIFSGDAFANEVQEIAAQKQSIKDQAELVQNRDVEIVTDGEL